MHYNRVRNIIKNTMIFGLILFLIISGEVIKPDDDGTYRIKKTIYDGSTYSWLVLGNGIKQGELDCFLIYIVFFLIYAFSW